MAVKKSSIDRSIIHFFQKINPAFERLVLFVVFFWFGALKIFSTSPANPLVKELLEYTLPSVPFESFVIFLGLFEIAIGIAFIIPRLERLAITLLVLHMITTFLPLVFLPNTTWQSFLTPTLTGQYIIKNLVIIALAINIAAGLRIRSWRK